MALSIHVLHIMAHTLFSKDSFVDCLEDDISKLLDIIHPHRVSFSHSFVIYCKLMSFQLNYVCCLDDGVNKTTSDLRLCKMLYNTWTSSNLNLSNPKWKEWMLKAPSHGGEYPHMCSCFFLSYFLFLIHRY